MTTSDRYEQLDGNTGDVQPERRSILGRSPIFTPEVINDIHMKSELGRYRMRGFSIFKDIPHWDELIFLPGTLTRFVIESNAGSLAGAALRGGDLVVKGRVGARTGIDQKGGTVIVLGSAGSMTGFMMQRGRQIILGDVGPGLGDSMYDGTLYVAGKVAALGIDCVEGEWTDADTEVIERKFRIYGLGSPPELQKFVCGKQLYNYDNLEPSERKLVL